MSEHPNNEIEDKIKKIIINNLPPPKLSVSLPGISVNLPDKKDTDIYWPTNLSTNLFTNTKFWMD